MRVQAFDPKPAVESFDESIVGWLARPAEVERDATLVSPEIEITRYKLGSAIDADRCWQTDLCGDLVQNLSDVGTTERESSLQRWREPGERIDDRIIMSSIIRWRRGLIVAI